MVVHQIESVYQGPSNNVEVDQMYNTGSLLGFTQHLNTGLRILHNI